MSHSHQDNTPNMVNDNMNSIFEVEGNLAMERLTTTFNSATSSNKVGPKRSLKKGMTPLPDDFEVSNYSVLCGRGKGCYNATGNRRLRVIVSTFLQQYVEAQNSPHDKTRIIEKVVNIVKEACPVGAFIKYENGQYYELSYKGSKEKVAALFRDCLQASYKEKETKTKQAKRRQSKSILRSSHQPSLHQFQLQIFQQQQQMQPQQTNQPQPQHMPSSQTPMQTPEAFPMFPSSLKQLGSHQLQRYESIGSQDSDTTRGSFYDVDTNRSVSIVTFDELTQIDIDSLMG